MQASGNASSIRNRRLPLNAISRPLPAGSRAAHHARARLPAAWIVMVLVVAAFYAGASQQRRQKFPFGRHPAAAAVAADEAQRAAAERAAAIDRSRELATLVFEPAASANAVIARDSAAAFLYDDLDFAIDLHAPACPAIERNAEFFERLGRHAADCIRIFYRVQQIDSTAVLLHAAVPRGRLVVYNHGHGGLPSPGDDWAFALLQSLLDRGTDVLLTSLPFVGLNHSDLRIQVLSYDGPSVVDLHRLSQHELLKTLDVGRSSYLRFFVDPAILPLVSLAGRYRTISYVGLSGGANVGLPTCALLKGLLHDCVLVAGVMPLDLRLQGDRSSLGDAEQVSVGLNRHAPVRHLIDEVARSGTRLHLIYNDRDPCCFDGELARALQRSISDPRVQVTVRASGDHDYDPDALLRIVEPPEADAHGTMAATAAAAVAGR